MSRLLRGLLALSLVLASALAANPGAQAAPATLRRIAGPGRVETAAMVAADAFPSGGPRVYLATADDFPDALAAGPAAAAFDGPVLLSSGSVPPEATVAELERLQAGQVVVVGGASAVPDQVLTQLGGLARESVRRVAGADRFATAAQLARDAFAAPVPVAYVATAGGFADALTGGPAAARSGGPLLLVTVTGLPAATAQALADLRPGRIVVLGGSGVVNEEVVSQLRATTTGAVERLAGPDRFATAVAVSAATFPQGASTVYLATGENFPDALAGGPAAARAGAPLLLTGRTRLPDVVAAELRRLSPEQIVVLGGESAVSQQVADEAAAAAGGSRGDPAAQPVTGAAHPIAFAYEPASGCQGPCEQETTIWTMRSDGGAAAPVTVSQDSFDRSPRWAPDGSQLAFARVSRATGAGDLYVLAVAGDGFAAPRRITDTADVHGGRGCYGTDMVPAWSPDSARIAFTCGDGDDGASAVLVAAADGSGQFSVPAEATDADAWPTWSPGSDRLAFARRDLSTRFGDPGRVAVWTAEMGASGAANPRPLVSGERAAGHPQWSPVGDQILFVELDELALRPTLKVVTVATGDSRVLYEPPRDRNVALYHASWSPNGSAVALPVGDGLNDSVVHVIDAATGRSVAVSPPGTVALAPGWSPDGSRVLFDAVTRDQAGATVQQLVTVGTDGGSQALLGVPGGHAYDASWRPGS